MENYVIRGYEPAKLFSHFEDISRIPRGSGNEKGIADFLVAFAEHDNVSAPKPETFEQFRIAGRRSLGNKIFFETVGFQRRADYLFDLSVVKVDAGTKEHF